MKVIKEKSFKVNFVAPESKEEDAEIKKIISNAKSESKKPFDPKGLIVNKPKFK